MAPKKLKSKKKPKNKKSKKRRTSHAALELRLMKLNLEFIIFQSKIAERVTDDWCKNYIIY